MGYTVKVNGFEILCETADDVRALIGTAAPVPSEKRREQPPRQGSDGGERSAADHALLKSLVDGSTVGIPSGTVGSLLSTRGKGMPGAFERWAKRVGLPDNAVESVRVGVGRGWRLSAGGLAAGRVILGGD